MAYLIGSYHFKAVKYFLILVLKLKSLATTSHYNSKMFQFYMKNLSSVQCSSAEYLMC